MTILWCESFGGLDSSTIPLKYIENATPSIGTNVTRTNPANVVMNFGNNEHIDIPVSSTPQTVVFGFAFQMNAAGGNTVAYEDPDDDVHLILAMGDGGNFRLYRGGTLLAIATRRMLLDRWYYIETKVTIDNTNGAFEMIINGETVIDISGIDTDNTGISTIGTIRIGSLSTNNGRFFTDLYVADLSGPAPGNDYLGDIHVDAKFPNADGFENDWTPLNGGDNYVEVDDTAPDEDTTYNFAGTVDDIDVYEFEDLPISPEAIISVQVNITATKATSGPNRQINDVIRSGSNLYAGAGSVNFMALPLGYAELYSIHDTDPRTGGQWTEANLNNAQFGVRINE